MRETTETIETKARKDFQKRYEKGQSADHGNEMVQSRVAEALEKEKRGLKDESKQGMQDLAI